ncbi:PE family protein [Mycolicibacterium smegmatis]|uniref:PE family protein n=1 Tax=Mycolicibacterium smegmatis TaxID=1772 RepID=UPI0013038E35|nr:PE family protein [Mycolicibacterium smegmatis]
MADLETLRLKPAEIVAATEQLDGMADRLHQLMDREKTNLTPAASGSDEVSQRVAATLNEVYAAFQESLTRGVTEIQEIAATVRAHSDNIREVDEGFRV